VGFLAPGAVAAGDKVMWARVVVEHLGFFAILSYGRIKTV
jgi:hypothetical protein